MKPLVSVIIPVYNVEQYLNRCVDSVLEQTEENLQIILVDDGSPDGSGAICDQYAEKDDRIQVIHKENGGLASARNAGMKLAEGKYLFFLDSDDWLEKDGMERLVRTAEEYHVDFVRYRAIRTGWPGLPENAPCMVEPVRELEGGYYDKTRIVSEIYPRLLATSSLTFGAILGAWGSLYNLEFLQKNNLVFFEDIRFSEDVPFSARVVACADNFFFIDEPIVYHYFYNPNSISKSFRADRWDSCRKIIDTCEGLFRDYDGYDFSSQLLYLRWFCILLALNEKKFLRDDHQRKEYCRSIIHSDIVQHTKAALSQLNVGYKQKLQILLIKMGLSGIVAKS